MVIKKKLNKWRKKMGMSSNPWDIAEQQYKKTQQRESAPSNPWDIAQKQYDNIPKEESRLQSLGRHAARTGSRIVETIAGMPTDVANFTKYMLKNVPGIGGVAGTIAQNFAPEQYEQAIEATTGAIGSKIPGSQELKEFSEKNTGGLTKAKTPGEEKSDEVFQDLTALLIPIKGKVPGITKTIGTEVAAQLGKEGVKMLGGSDNSQNLTKAAVMFTGGLIRPKNALDYANSLYDKADTLLPKGATVNASKLGTSLDNMVTTLEKGLGSDLKEKAPVINAAKKILSKMKDGKIEVEELTSFNRDINKLMGEPETLKGAKTFLKGIGKEVRSAIKPYEATNPKFVKTWMNANEAWGTIAQSKKVSNSINSFLKLTPLKSGIGLLFETATLGGSAAGITAAGSASLYGALKGSELMYRVMKSPVLRTHYLNVIKSALKENGPAAIQALKNLDKEILKQDQKKSSSLSAKK